VRAIQLYDPQPAARNPHCCEPCLEHPVRSPQSALAIRILLRTLPRTPPLLTLVRDEPKMGSVRLRLIGLRKGRSDFDVPWHARSNGTFCSLWGPVVFKTNIFARSTRPPDDTVTDYSQYQNPKNVFGRLRSLHKSPAQERRCPWYTYVTL
jgi:hypothetical protein